jgi:predicted kinase
MLIVIAGLPGAGKSTLALDLGRALGCAVLGVDQAEAAMWRAGVSPSGPTHHAAYLVVGALAAEQLALGHHVIVDAVNGPEPARAQWRDLSAQMDSDLRFIVVDCSDDRVFQDRLAHRIRHIEGYPEPTWERSPTAPGRVPAVDRRPAVHRLGQLARDQPASGARLPVTCRARSLAHRNSGRDHHLSDGAFVAYLDGLARLVLGRVNRSQQAKER